MREKTRSILDINPPYISKKGLEKSLKININIFLVFARVFSGFIHKILGRREVDFFVATLQKEQAGMPVPPNQGRHALRLCSLQLRSGTVSKESNSQGSELVELQVYPYGKHNRHWF
jgi:hypothetical protein